MSRFQTMLIVLILSNAHLTSCSKVRSLLMELPPLALSPRAQYPPTTPPSSSKSGQETLPPVIGSAADPEHPPPAPRRRSKRQGLPGAMMVYQTIPLFHKFECAPSAKQLEEIPLDTKWRCSPDDAQQIKMYAFKIPVNIFSDDLKTYYYFPNGIDDESGSIPLVAKVESGILKKCNRDEMPYAQPEHFAK